MVLFPESINQYVTEDDPVRVYDAFIENLNIGELGIVLDENQVGNPSYDPKAMLKLLVYGYSYGWRSSRKLERATQHNLSFIWLMGGLKPDYRTIIRFRFDNASVLEKVLKQCAQLCIRLKLIAGNTLFIDGTKIEANASKANAWTDERCQIALAKIDKRIAAILNESEAVDHEESSLPSMVKTSPELRDQEKRAEKIKQIMREIKQSAEKQLNATDPDCKMMRTATGSCSGYNAQIVVDEKQGLIVHSDVVDARNDLHQFSAQLTKANTTLKKTCKTACADAGYSNADDLETVDEEITIVVPTNKQASKKEIRSFGKEMFYYDAEHNEYICPEGHRLLSYGRNATKKSFEYKIRNAQTCHACRHFGICTNAKNGRKIQRYYNEEFRQQLAQQYETPEGQQIYALRKQKVELPFGHIKQNMGVKRFLVRGIHAVRGEMALLACCFNLSRMINIIGVEKLITQMSA